MPQALWRNASEDTGDANSDWKPSCSSAENMHHACDCPSYFGIYFLRKRCKRTVRAKQQIPFRECGLRKLTLEVKRQWLAGRVEEADWLLREQLVSFDDQVRRIYMESFARGISRANGVSCMALFHNKPSFCYFERCAQQKRKCVQSWKDVTQGLVVRLGLSGGIGRMAHGHIWRNRCGLLKI